MTAVGAADAGESEVQVAAAKKAVGHVAANGSPRTVTTGVALVGSALELGEVTLNGSVQRGLSRLAPAVDWCGLCGEADYGKAVFRFERGKGQDEPWILPGVYTSMYTMLACGDAESVVQFSVAMGPIRESDRPEFI